MNTEQRTLVPVWIEGARASRNMFAWFRREFDWYPADRAGETDTGASEASIHIFADQRYRLYCNGQSIACGPTRFTPEDARADRIDLGTWLVEGRNTLWVEVANFGAAGCYQAVPHVPGFAVTGRFPDGCGGVVDLATPGAWVGADSSARLGDSAALSFALGPVEILDHVQWLSEIETDAGQPVVEVTDGAWTIHAESILPSPQRIETRPRRQTFLGALSDRGEDRVPCFFTVADSVFQRQQPIYCETWIHAPAAVSVDIGLFWGRHFFNDEVIEVRDDTSGGNRQVGVAHLRAGWNHLAGVVPMFNPCWGVLWGFPRDRGLHIHPEKQQGGCPTVRAALGKGAQPPEGWRPGRDGFEETEAGWTLFDTQSANPMPSREVAWDVSVAYDAKQGSARRIEFPVAAEIGTSGIVAMCFDFEAEYMGHLEIDLQIEGRDACCLDTSYSEAAVDGRVSLYREHFLVNACDRFRLSKGRVRLRPFHVRGGRFLQLTFRGSVGTQIQIHDLVCLRTRTPQTECGDFQCEDEAWKWLFRTGKATLDASCLDVWVDSPWREQGCYLGDAYVQFQANRLLSADGHLPRRVLELFAQSALPDGMLPVRAGGIPDRACEDFSLIFVKFLQAYVEASGDEAIGRALYPVAEGVLRSAHWRRRQTDSVLWTAGEGFCFIDWGIEPAAREGINACLNLFRLEALRSISVLARQLSMDKVATEWRDERERVRTSFIERFWEDEAGCYQAAWVEGQAVASTCLHANLLARAFGIVPEGQDERLDAFLCDGLTRNADLIRAKGLRGGQPELYILAYAIEGLICDGRVAEAETLVLENWLPMQAEEAVTFWESLAHGFESSGSLCHSWSCAPLVLLREGILGVRPQSLNHWRIEPFSARLQLASGVVPHPLGPVSIRWSVDAATIHIEVDAPEGIEIEVGLHPAWGSRKLNVKAPNSSADYSRRPKS